MQRFEYCYPGTNVLKNKLGIQDQERLFDMERGLTFFRLYALEKNPIQGNFDLDHLEKIHRHIFQDIYEWAGQIRTEDIAKGKSIFALRQFIEPLCNDLFKELRNENYLKGLAINQFSERLAYYTSEINAYHPFREGNGRTTREFIRCLAKDAGYELSYSEIDKGQLMDAYIDSFQGDNSQLAKLYKEHLKPITQDQERTLQEDELSLDAQEMDDDWDYEL
ncbi:Fic/DOC family protein [Desulfitobacterium hafniense]|uniref:Fic/DOC family protein n=1 Tax=Desulfitobacterium hafniense TaxID=49338 RepID=UPI00037FE274|nr:Fic family protein [Desulfitobacterium hafniense]